MSTQVDVVILIRDHDRETWAARTPAVPPFVDPHESPLEDHCALGALGALAFPVNASSRHGRFGRGIGRYRVVRHERRGFVAVNDRTALVSPGPAPVPPGYRPSASDCCSATRQCRGRRLESAWPEQLRGQGLWRCGRSARRADGVRGVRGRWTLGNAQRRAHVVAPV